MSPAEQAILFLVGVGAGYVNVMAGGGSLLTVPVMLFMGLPAPVANGTNRIAILAQSVVSCWVFFRKGLSEFKLSLTLALCTLPGAWLGARLGVTFEGIWFNRVLALIMVAVMVLMVVERRTVNTDPLSHSPPRRVVLTHILMLVVGFYGGVIQVGVGFLIMPILHRVMGLDLLRVNMHKIFVVLPFTLMCLFIYAAEAGVVWLAGLYLGLGNALGGWVATHMMIRRGERLIKIVFNLALLAMIIKLVFFPSN